MLQRGCFNFLVQLANQLVALINQIVRLLPLPTGSGPLDIAVQNRNLLGIAVDKIDAIGDLPGEPIGYIRQALIDSLESVHGKLRITQQGLARRH